MKAQGVGDVYNVDAKRKTEMEFFIITKLFMALLFIPEPQGYSFEMHFKDSTECAVAKKNIDDAVCAGSELYVRRLPTLSDGK